jgi:environmental stress-induced protein Ves
MTLSHAGGGEHRLSLLSPYRFAGELETYGALEAPPARDFNVMVRRDRASAAVSVRALEPGATLRAEGEAETHILHVLRGTAHAEIDGEALDLLTGETLITMRATLTAGPPGATAILITIGPPGQFAGAGPG